MIHYTSPSGDLLVIGPRRSDVRVIYHKNVAQYRGDPAATPAYLVDVGLHLATLSLGVEMGLAFEIVSTDLLPGLKLPAPVLSVWLGGKVKALLVQADIPVPQCQQVFASDSEIKLIVCLSYALPRNRRFEYVAGQLMWSDFKDQLHGKTTGGEKR